MLFRMFLAEISPTGLIDVNSETDLPTNRSLGRLL
jgi:hypothetical protein